MDNEKIANSLLAKAEKLEQTAADLRKTAKELLFAHGRNAQLQKFIKFGREHPESFKKTLAALGYSDFVSFSFDRRFSCARLSLASGEASFLFNPGNDKIIHTILIYSSSLGDKIIKNY